MSGRTHLPLILLCIESRDLAYGKMSGRYVLRLIPMRANTIRLSLFRLANVYGHSAELHVLVALYNFDGTVSLEA